MTPLVLTLIGDDKPGLVNAASEAVAEHGGTWLESRLARLAESSQVIVVTHLAQVAAFADRHFVVAKATDGQVTTSGIVRVEAAERLDELARMVAGLESSANAHAHAAELLAAATPGH